MVLFESNVKNVEITCSGKSVTTPGSISLKQSRNHSCRAEKEGHAAKTFRIRSILSKKGFQDSTRANTKSWGWWTLGVGTLLGWSVDLLSGAMRDFEVHDFHVEMQEASSVSGTKRALGKVLAVGKTLLRAPGELIDNSTSTVMDTAVRGSAEKLGVSSVKEEIHYPSLKGPKKI